MFKRNDIMPDSDDRREIRKMISHLPPERRLQWLRWCCRQLSDPGDRRQAGNVTTYVESNGGSTAEVFSDALMLMWGSGLTLRMAGDRLADMLKGRC